jgi:mannose-6-phosphate isomerase class I
MSFMFNPFQYEDLSPINRPTLSEETINSILSTPKNILVGLLDEILTRYEKNNSTLTIGMDAYVSADWKELLNLLTGELTRKKINVNVFDVASSYKGRNELDEMLAEYLPQDREKDPVLLFGKLFKGSYETLFDKAKLDSLKCQLKASHGINIVYGAGSCFSGLRQLYDIVTFIDITPKMAVLRIKNGKYKNLGDSQARPFKEIMRRCYYYDFELALHLRAELIGADLIDFYIAGDNWDNVLLLPRKAFNEICSSLVNYPFRCKPVYLEGVWGGYYIKNLRNLPHEMKNCAWVFDLIPLEVSLLVQAGKKIVEIPFFAFVNREGKALMGEECVKAFNGYFPIRFNFDDSYHSSGNMSIQLHPQADYCKENFNEHGRQDESYYVIATGHGAKTFVGMNDNVDAKEFIAEIKKSELDSSPVDYEKYVNGIASIPGMQFMLPAGTIHSSGRNQLILEIGSLTVGSYTFKIYDYLRLDFDGNPRPIHSYHGERVLDSSRNASWVKQNIAQKPKLLRSGDGWAEYLLGQHDLLYFSLFRYEFEKRIEGDTNGVFHVLTLVDGEKIAVYPKLHPERRYLQNYLDIVVIPANVGPYVIENLGDQPVCVHKTCLKNNFTKFI